MLRKIAKLYLDNPEFGWVYSYNWNDYILIDNIPNEHDFHIYWIKIDQNWRVYIENKKVKMELLNIIIK